MLLLNSPASETAAAKRRRHPTVVARDLNAIIGQRIRMARLNAGLTQDTLALAAGVTFQQIQKYEKGINRVSAGALVLIAQAVGRPVAWFFDETPLTTAATKPDRAMLEWTGLYDRLKPKARKAVLDLAKSLDEMR